MVPGTASSNNTFNNKAFLSGELYWTNNGISIYVAAKRQPGAEEYRRRHGPRLWPIGPVGKPTELHLVYPILAMNYTKYPQACKALIAFMMEADNFNGGSKRAGLPDALPHAYETNPVWTADPKTHAVSAMRQAFATAGGLGSVGEKAATAIADFVVLDMFASYCTGREDAKGAIAIAERQCSGSSLTLPRARRSAASRRLHAVWGPAQRSTTRSNGCTALGTGEPCDA